MGQWACGLVALCRRWRRDVLVKSAPSESLPGSRRLAVAAPMGVVPHLEGAAVEFLRHAPGESLDPAGSGSGIVPAKFPPLGHYFGDRRSFSTLPLGWTRTASRLVGSQQVMRVVGIVTVRRRRWWCVQLGRGLSF
jgi:hypothetical protein